MTAVQRPSLVRRAAVLLLLTAGLVFGAALPSWASFTTRSPSRRPSPPRRSGSRPPHRSRDLQRQRRLGVAELDRQHRAAGLGLPRPPLVQRVAGRADGDRHDLDGHTSTAYINGYVDDFTVWTLTPYGWTAESAALGAVFCS